MSSTSEGTAAGADSGTSAAVLLLAPSPPHAVQPRCSRSRQSGPEKALKKRVYVLSRRLQSLAHDHVELQAKDALRRHLSDAARTVLHATAAMRSATLAVAADGGASMGQRYYQRQEAVLADMLVTLCELPAATQGAEPGCAAHDAGPALSSGASGGGGTWEDSRSGAAEPGAAVEAKQAAASAGATRAAACASASAAADSEAGARVERIHAQPLVHAGPLQHGDGGSGSGGGVVGAGAGRAAAEGADTLQVAASPVADAQGTAGAAVTPPAPLPAALSAPPPAHLPCWVRMMPADGAEALAAVRQASQVGQADISAELKLFAQAASLELMSARARMGGGDAAHALGDAAQARVAEVYARIAELFGRLSAFQWRGMCVNPAPMMRALTGPVDAMAGATHAPQDAAAAVREMRLSDTQARTVAALLAFSQRYVAAPLKLQRELGARAVLGEAREEDLALLEDCQLQFLWRALTSFEALWNHVLRPEQAAACWVAYWPFIPTMVSLRAGFRLVYPHLMPDGGDTPVPSATQE